MILRRTGIAALVVSISVGYYLATAVLAYVLWRQLRPRNPLIADLSTLAAVGYALAGGMGAAVLAVVAPMLMNAYTNNSVPDCAHC